MTFSQRVVSITQDTILPKVVDNILNDNFATFRFISNGEAWSGETLKKPIKISKNSLGGSFSGLDQHSTGTVETRITLSFDPRAYEIPVSIPGLEKAVNGISESQVLNLVKTELESTQMDALDDIGSMFYLDGTGNSNKDFLGMDALDDDGTSASSVGNQSRTTYTALRGVRTASGGTLTIAKMATLFSSTVGGSAGRQQPTMWVSSETEYDFYEQLLSPTVRANYEINGFPVVTRKSRGVMQQSSLKGGMGYTALVYRGVPWVKDEKAPVGTLWLWNENYLQWYGIKDKDLDQISLGGSMIEGVYTDAPTDNTGMQWTGFLRPVNQYGEVAHLYLLGNMITSQPRRQGRLTGITGV